MAEVQHPGDREPSLTLELSAAAGQRMSARQRLSTRFRHRLFHGKGVILVLSLNILIYIFYAASILSILPFIRHSTPFSSAVQLILVNCFTVLFPITGFIADVCLGRHRTIVWSMIMMWIALGTLSLSSALRDGEYLETFSDLVLPVPAILLLITGLAGFEANIIPFRPHQIK